MNNPQVDKYIENSADFAKPILIHIRKIVHQACPDVEETIKWGFPCFEYKGVICSMTSFKAHCALGFWKESLIPVLKDYYKKKEEAMGSIGQVKSLQDLPPDELLLKATKMAMELNEKGIKVPKKPKDKVASVKIPDYFTKALSKAKKAKENFDNFSLYKKKEYVDWLEEAKSEETRLRRLDQAIIWISEGKIRNWKYVRNG